jgi:hypothetical protein
MGDQDPSVWDYTRAEWIARDSRRDLAYEVARKLGYTPDNARRTADQVAAKEPGSESSPRSSGRPAVHVSRRDPPTGGDPFSWVKLPGGD